MWQMSLQWTIRHMINDNIWWTRQDNKQEFCKTNIIFRLCCKATIQLFYEIKTHAFNSEITAKL